MESLILSSFALKIQTMESRILSSGPTTISSLRSLTKPVARINTVAVPSPARLTSNGANLVWGKQLRPSLLNLDYYDAAPVGFLAKYPFLVTGFFFFMWYFLNVIFNILNKKIYNYFPYPYFVSVIHLAVGVVYCLGSWTVGLPKRAVSLECPKAHTA
ncbi:hypothetical protein R6Q59_006493 [Mikania micrantha]